MRAKPDHVLVVFSTHPYASQSIKVAGLAKVSDLKIVAVIDSSESPLGTLAHEVVVMDQILMDYTSTRILFFALIEYLVESGCSLQDRKSRRELKQFRN